jgi:Ca-activated chloride channel homolog
MVKINNYYSKLKVSRDATPDELRYAYFEAARRLHPDTNPSPDAAEQFIQIQEAYEILSNPEKRLVYDANININEPIDPAVSLNLLYSRAELPRLDEPQLFYALVQLVSTAEISEHETPPLNICLVLDRSTSMQGTRMDMVKANAIQILRQIRPDDYFSIIVFSDRAEVLVQSSHLFDIVKAEAEISLLQTGGGTEIYQGLLLGLSELKRNQKPAYINHLILLTDGRTYGDDEACLRLAEEAVANGIGISSLGFGHEYNDAFLDKLAGNSGGSSMHISATKDLHKYLVEKFNSLGRVYAESVALELQLHEDVELRYAFRLQPELGRLNTEFPIRLGNLQYTKNLTFILEFLVKRLPEQVEDLQIAKGRIIMELPLRSVPNARFKLNISRPISDYSEAQSPNSAILRAMSSLTLYRLQEKARQEVIEGDLNTATRHLQHLATHLLSLGERELAHTVLLEAEHIQKAKQYSKEGDKKIKYGTRALLLTSGTE